jgi:four helix bundle protein
MGIVAEEADESLFWLEMLAESGIVKEQRIEQLLKESHELTAIFTASVHTTKASRT